MHTVSWKEEPEQHDYPAAGAYLSLLATADEVNELVGRLRSAQIEHYKAKDLLRAAKLWLLPTDNPHVAADLAKIRSGKALSPVLLIHGDLSSGVPLQIADGYHRVCASYHVDENTAIPAKIVDRHRGQGR